MLRRRPQQELAEYTGMCNLDLNVQNVIHFPVSSQNLKQPPMALNKISLTDVFEGPYRPIESERLVVGLIRFSIPIIIGM